MVRPGIGMGPSDESNPGTSDPCIRWVRSDRIFQASVTINLTSSSEFTLSAGHPLFNQVFQFSDLWGLWIKLLKSNQLLFRFLVLFFLNMQDNQCI